MSKLAKVNYLMGGVNAELTERLYPMRIRTAKDFLMAVKLEDEAQALARAKRNGDRTVITIDAP